MVCGDPPNIDCRVHFIESIAALEQEVAGLRAENEFVKNELADARGWDDAQKMPEEVKQCADDFYAKLEAELAESFPAEGEACEQKLADLRAKLESE